MTGPYFNEEQKVDIYGKKGHYHQDEKAFLSF